MNIKNNNQSLNVKIVFLLLGSIFLPAFFGSLGFIFHIQINNFTYLISILFLLIIYYVNFYAKENKKNFLIPILVALIIILISFFVSTKIYDNSADGWGYHMPSIIKLSDGWNPLYNHYDDENIINIWSEHYPKVVWVYAASLYKVTKNVFIGESFNIIITITTFILLIDIFKKKNFSTLLSIFFSAIISFNTISISQLFTHYNDGILGLCILSILLLYDSLVKDEYKIENNLSILLILAFYLSILANIKYNGALYAFILFIIYSIVLFVKKRFSKSKFLIKYILIIGLSVIVVATNSYLTNIIYHKNVGYPIMGKGKIEIISQYIPQYIDENDNKIVSFIKSFTKTFGYSEYRYNPFFNVYHNDFYCAAEADCRENGFGPLYQSIIILTSLLLLIYVYEFIRKMIIKEINFKTYIKSNILSLVPFVIMAIFFFITPATWWSRYIPYIYSLPILIVIFINDEWHICNIKSILSYNMLIIYLVSILGISSSMIFQMHEFTTNLKNEIVDIKNINSDIIDIAVFDYWNENYKNTVSDRLLENNNIKFERHDENECAIIKNYSMLGLSVVNCNKGE